MGRAIAPQPDEQAGPRKSPAASAASSGRWKSDAVELSDLWRKYETKPEFFKNLEMAQDGGFTELPTLFQANRFFWAALTVVCLLMNLSAVAAWNIYELRSIHSSIWIGDASDKDRWLILNSFVGVFLGGDRRVNFQVMLAFLELGMLVYYLVKSVLAMHRVACHKGAARWHGVAICFWDVVPELSAFSAMKSLHYVTPQVVAPALMYKVGRLTHGRAEARDVWELAKFVLACLFHLFVGFEAFMIKFTIAYDVLNTATSEFQALFASLAFLNQLLGIVNVHKFSRRRLFLFIFGGEDAWLSKREETIAATWLGMLAERMWQDAPDGRAAVASTPTSPCTGMKVAWFLALALSYGDADFQKLVLNEEAKATAKAKAKNLDLQVPGATA